MGRLVDIEDAAWPLVIVVIPPALDEPAIASMYAGFDRLTDRKEKFSAVVDTSAMTTFPNPIERKLIADGRISRTLTEATYNVGNAVLMTSAPARLVLKLIEWVRPPVVPQQVVATREEGIAWCARQLVKARVPLTPALEALRQSANVNRSTSHSFGTRGSNPLSSSGGTSSSNRDRPASSPPPRR